MIDIGGLRLHFSGIFPVNGGLCIGETSKGLQGLL